MPLVVTAPIFFFFLFLFIEGTRKSRRDRETRTVMRIGSFIQVSPRAKGRNITFPFLLDRSDREAEASYLRYLSVLTLNCASRLSQLDSDVPGKILSNFL